MSRVQPAERRHQADEASADRFELAPDVGDRADDPHASAFVVSASSVYIASSSGRSRRIAATCASTVAQSPREIGPVSSKPFSIVRRISGSSACGGAPAAVEQRAGGPSQRDEVVRGDRGARVVGVALLVRERERLEAERPREPEAVLAGLVALRGHRREGAVELLGPAGEGERLQRMDAEAARVRVERRE